MEKAEAKAKIQAALVIRELNHFSGFDHWWYMIDDNDRDIILKDLVKIILEASEKYDEEHGG